MNVILYVWMAVAVGSGGRPYEGWVNLGGYDNYGACAAAAGQLGLSKDRMRCINTKTGKQE
jgi:hypothetical protein